ncbi:pyruvate dehydrogenase phosphatase regulatory subunit, mitochondrial-like [Leptonychotes weddellii]|uniref:Pyruvate dehydrogenase phosphatase regulatory subunit, mitochondrial-like n=1 Tax=Leptonychotes weddellii TaxID=9713 RepID=A0A7F8RRL3_LEPWE|nr:pyruvate dehydrogenase phosphatase regulatory subunit, mitochondrial-like [Leptonychotes weddellii]
MCYVASCMVALSSQGDCLVSSGLARLAPQEAWAAQSGLVFLTGYIRTGSVFLAQTQDRLISLKRINSRLNVIGIPSEIISPKKVAELHPLLNVHDLVGAMHVPEDAVVSSADVALALASAASQNGVQIYDRTSILHVMVKKGQVTGVETDKGQIECQYFVNCAGQWAYELGLSNEEPVSIPLHACEHFYVLTRPLETPLRSNTPTIVDADGRIYIRNWQGGILFGGFEKNPKPIFTEGKNQLEIQNLQEDWDHFEPLLRLSSRCRFGSGLFPSRGSTGKREAVGTVRGVHGQAWKRALVTGQAVVARPQCRSRGGCGALSAHQQAGAALSRPVEGCVCQKGGALCPPLGCLSKGLLSWSQHPGLAVREQVQNRLCSWAQLSPGLASLVLFCLALNLIGPRAVDVLSELSYAPMTPGHFPSLFCKEMSVGYANGIRVMSMTHTGEPGFMLYIPIEVSLPEEGGWLSHACWALAGLESRIGPGLGN